MSSVIEPSADHDVPRSAADGPQLRTILLTDLVESTALVEQLGDGPAADLFREHDRLVVELQQQWRGRLIDRSDGLLLLFERAIDGLGFALDYNRGLRAIGESRKVTLQARTGLHVGEVLSWRNSDVAVSLGAKPLEVEGLAKPFAARLMTLARPGQILLSAVAEPLAHRAARELGERGEQLLWKSYGRWCFKGIPEAQEIYEVGEAGVAPLRAPKSTAKSWRDIPFWRRPAALGAELLLVACLGTGVWFMTRPQPAIAFGERDWVVVGDLRNLTGDKLLDDSLQQAFRISLEQSRFVNVLSDLKARDTLALMQRKPGTALDRAIASEIALRDGARAVILPTVSEVGGRVRVSVEVIDPQTQTTVYAESADGNGAASTLGSIDDVTAALRGKLGEALESVEKTSVPLPQVATGDLDALRTYALGVKAYAQGRSADALQYFQRATQLDSQFALAYMGSLRVEISEGHVDRAKPLLAKALSLRQRLPARDALYLDAWVAEFGPHSAKAAMEKWKLLAEIYPDYYAGDANFAWAAFSVGRYEDALKSAQKTTARQNPLAQVGFEQVGRIQLARDHYPDALRAFRQAETGGRPASRQHAAALAATRRFAPALALLDKQPPTDLTANFERISIALDQGQWDQARRTAAATAEQAKAADPLLADLFAVVDLSIRTLAMHDAVSADNFRATINTILANVDAGGSAYAADRLYFALAVAYMAQRSGHGGVVSSMLPNLAERVHAAGDPRAEQMLVIVQAGQLHLAGNADKAIPQLQELIDGHELYQAHAALRDALVAARRNHEALRED
ncbi:MAG: putative peptide modification system cyclase, partial [Luteimonas sp.]